MYIFSLEIYYLRHKYWFILNIYLKFYRLLSGIFDSLRLLSSFLATFYVIKNTLIKMLNVCVKVIVIGPFLATSGLAS